MKFESFFFGSYSTTIQVLIYACLILALWLVELRLLATSLRDKWGHTTSNILFILTGLPVQLFMSVFVLMASAWVMRNHAGLLNMSSGAGGLIVKYLLGFLLLDFCEYIYHVIMHKVKPLWKFHIVHHTDQQLDVSTTVREHPCETFIRMCFLLIWVFLLGASFQLLLIRQTLQTIANITSHTHFRLPHKVERWVGLIFVTPNIHQVHHHYQMPYTDTNYGDILSIWDRIFGTYSTLDIKQTVFGVDSQMDSEVSNSFIKVLKIPFRV